MIARRSSAGPMIVLACIILLPALALFGLWRYAEGRAGEFGEPLPTTIPGAPEPAAPAPALVTPLLSFRRIPGLVARDLNDDAFRQQVQAFADTLDGTSCLAVQLDGVDVGSHNPDLPVIPASNQKLLVGAAALRVLGADHRFTTEVRAAGVSGGVVAGDLYVVGGGDPLLTTDDFPEANIFEHPVTHPTSLDALADAVVAAGVTRIDGNVVGDGTRYDDELFHPSWPDDVLVTEAGPFDALLVNDSRLFDGSEWQVANDPADGAAAELTRLLEARGVSIGGEATAGTAAGGDVIASVASEPLPAVIGEMMSTSDNNTAEMLVKEMGVARGGGGTIAAGAAAMTAALTELGLDTTGLVISDGSGLSNDNRVTCRVLAGILSLHQPGNAFAAELPVAGQSGTLSDVFTDSPVGGRLVAKTGTLGNAPFNADPPSVKALSGYLPVEGGGTIEFAFILNSSGTLTDQSVYRPIWDEFARVLATYPAGPTAADLGPG